MQSPRLSGVLGRLMVRGCLVLFTVLALVGCVQPFEEQEDRPMSTSVELFRYGFRYDPMQWVENDRTLQGALVRTCVFGRPKEGDREIVEAEIGKILADQQENGSFNDEPGKTAEEVRRLLKLGCPADAEGVVAAAKWLRAQLPARQEGPEEMLGVAAALCEAGHGAAPEVQSVFEWARAAGKEKLVTDIAGICPWSLTGRLRELWGCRRAEGMDAPLQIVIDVFEQNVTPAGTMCFVDTGGLYPVFGQRDCPGGREIIRRMIPRILRSQEPDGGWGGGTFDVLRALVSHNFLDELLPLPPLPPDWRITRALDLPDTDLYGLTWGNGALWVCDRSKGEVMAISPDDGSIQKRLALPDGPGPGAEIGWWEGRLVHTQGVPEPQSRQPDSQKLFLIDPDSGEVQKEFALNWIPRITSATQMHDEQYGDKLWLCDPGEGILYYLDPRTGEHDYGPDVADANVKRVFPANQGVWSAGWEHGMLLKSDRNGWRLLDYGDMPFAGPTDYFSHPGPGYCDGMAWDGQNLWALDAREKRICAIEKVGHE